MEENSNPKAPGRKKVLPTADPEKMSPRAQQDFERKRRIRKQRMNFGPVQKLGLSPEQVNHFERRGEVVHWFNDIPGRLKTKEEQMWRYVTKDEIEPGGIGKEGDPTTVEGMDNRVTRVVGTEDNRQPITAYLMALPKEYAEDDIRAKSDLVKERETAIMQGIDGQGRPGDKEGRYIPKHTGTSIRRGR